MSPPTCRRSLGVRDHLTQVVLNLVLNAIDATDDQGRIHVEAQAEDGWLVLSVEDDGRGISLADRCRLFQPFFTTKPHGTGLGLFVSRQILEDFSRHALASARSRARGPRSSSGCPWSTADRPDRRPTAVPALDVGRRAAGARAVRARQLAARGERRRGDPDEVGRPGKVGR